MIVRFCCDISPPGSKGHQLHIFTFSATCPAHLESWTGHYDLVSVGRKDGRFLVWCCALRTCTLGSSYDAALHKIYPQQNFVYHHCCINAITALGDMAACFISRHRALLNLWISPYVTFLVTISFIIVCVCEISNRNMTQAIKHNLPRIAVFSKQCHPALRRVRDVTCILLLSDTSFSCGPLLSPLIISFSCNIFIFEMILA